MIQTAILVAVVVAMTACGSHPQADESLVPSPSQVASTAPPASVTPPEAPVPTTPEAPVPTTPEAPVPTTPEAPVPTTIVAVDPGEALPRFLALGDSYTIGQSVDFEERWPNQLVALMGDAGRLVATPDFIARTGWSTRDLLDAIEAAAPQGPFDLVSLQIGVNNQFGGGDLEVFRTEFRVLLGVAIELAGGDAARVLVLSIPDWSVTPFAPDGLRSRISYEVSLFNAVVGEEVTEAGVALVDVTASSKAARDDPALLAIDDLHPSGLMYAQWAQLALPDALATLQRGQED